MASASQICEMRQPNGPSNTMVMSVLLLDYYEGGKASTHPTLYPSGAPMSDSMVRGEAAMGPLL